MVKIIGSGKYKKFSKDIACILNIDYINVIINKFSGNEFHIKLKSYLYDEQVIIIQSTCNPVNDNLLKLLLLVDSIKLSGARKVISVIPYFGYSRQNQYNPLEPCSMKVIAKILKTAGIDHVITLDLHSKESKEYFEIGIENLDIELLFPLFINKINNISNKIIVSPDKGSINRAQSLAKALYCDFVFLNKIRTEKNTCNMYDISSSIKGKNCIIIDDIIDTGETIIKASNLLMNNGAKSIQVIATHAVFSRKTEQKLISSCIEKLFLANTIQRKFNNPKFYTLNITSILADAIKLVI
ncbi:ribose-phosphate diphosphokinase [Lyticum sinuosum]|uniref:ribose-phosphate diphosphokinase n=1 Tax=Lyticum sinuosum TaxID=1332059 RepID=A0AAE4VLJ4_9RICK|nr:ribose-phosphate diphosphokinase [Lyticum sinuosum]MDZ5761497.1 Ribose-phosphate pyrophosphokinase [Lyticum sinuosum]